MQTRKNNQKYKENIEKKEKILFIDFDGTLVESIEAHRKAFNLVLKKYNLRPIKRCEIESVFGYTSEEIIKRIFPNLDKKQIAKLAKEKKNLFIEKTYKLVRLLPKVNQTLRFLSKNNFLVLETNASEAEIKKIANHVGLDLSCFDLILTKEKVKHRKPNPELIKKAEKLLGTKKRIEYVIGDTMVDILLAKNAGIKAIAIAKKKKKDELKKFNPDYIVENFYEVPKIIT